MRILIAIIALILTSCAGVDIKRVEPDKDNEAGGIRYYEPAPFLLIYSDAQGNLKSEIVILPDVTNKRSIDPFAVLATNNSVLTFSNGMLTQGKITIDETVVPTQVFESIKAIAGTIAGAAFDAPEQKATTIPSPHLYRIIIKGDKAKLAGGPALDPVTKEEVMIEIKLTKKEETKKEETRKEEPK
jgi:hypothetical protein